MRTEPLTLSALVGVGASALVDGLRVGGPSGLFPAVLGGLLIAAAGTSLLRGRRGARPAAAGDRDTTVTVAPSLGRGWVQAIGLLLLGLFVALFAAALVFTPTLALIGGERRWPRLVLVTAGFVGGLYVFFSLLLRLPLPPDLVFG